MLSYRRPGVRSFSAHVNNMSTSAREGCRGTGCIVYGGSLFSYRRPGVRSFYPRIINLSISAREGGCLSIRKVKSCAVTAGGAQSDRVLCCAIPLLFSEAHPPQSMNPPPESSNTKPYTRGIYYYCFNVGIGSENLAHVTLLPVKSSFTHHQTRLLLLRRWSIKSAPKFIIPHYLMCDNWCDNWCLQEASGETLNILSLPQLTDLSTVGALGIEEEWCSTIVHAFWQPG